MSVADNASEEVADALSDHADSLTRPWSVGLATFLLLPYNVMLGVGGLELSLGERAGDDRTGITTLATSLGLLVTGLALVSLLLAVLTALGRPWARIVLAVLAVPTAYVEVYSAAMYLGDYPDYAEPWRMGLGFALHVPFLIIGIGLLFLPASWPWFARRR